MNALSHSRHCQRGLTLIEIMLALVISLVLLAGFIQIFISSKQAYRVQEGLARIQESGRVAMELLGRSIREAGYADISTNPTINYGKFSGTPIGGTNGASGASDSITVSFDSAQDCLSNDTETVTVPGAPGSVVNRAVNWFFLDGANLKCQPLDPNTSAEVGSEQTLIENVEDMQVLYGVDSDGDQTANSYVVAPAAGSSDWNNVVSVRVCLLVRSVENNLIDQAFPYQNCSGASVTPATTDRHVRRAFTAIFNLRNRINVSPAFWD